MSADFNTHANEAVSLANSPRRDSILDLIARNEMRRFFEKWDAQLAPDRVLGDTTAAEVRQQGEGT